MKARDAIGDFYIFGKAQIERKHKFSEQQMLIKTYSGRDPKSQLGVAALMGQNEVQQQAHEQA